MRYYLKGVLRASVKGFRTGDFTLAESIDDHNDRILSDMFARLVSGNLVYFKQITKTSITVWHRSTRPGVLVQESHIWKKDGELIPLSHQNINSFKDLQRGCGYITGAYITAKEAY